MELKTGLGPLSPKTGTRYDMLKREHLYQLVSYVLFDRSDAYALDSMGVYSARYGHFVRWSLGQALDTLAGQPVDLVNERRHVWALLTEPHQPPADDGASHPRNSAPANTRPQRPRNGRVPFRASPAHVPRVPAGVRITVQSDKVVLLDSVDQPPLARENDYDADQLARLHPDVLRAYRDINR